VYRGVILFCAAVFIMLRPPEAACQSAPASRIVQTVSGQACAIDWVSRNITVKWFEPDRGHFDEITIFAPRDTVITKTESPIVYSEIMVSDQVTVEYYDDPLDAGPLRATRITVIG